MIHCRITVFVTKNKKIKELKRNRYCSTFLDAFPGGVYVTVMFRNKRSQAKGVYYVFLSKQPLDNVYTRVAIHRFTIGTLHTVAHGC